MTLRGYKWVVKWYFLVGLGIRTGLRLGLDMVLGVILGVLYVRRRRYFGNVFLYSLPIGQVIKIGKKIWTYF